jgi:hypothetical protein
VRVHVASGVSGVRSFDNAKSFEMSSFSEKKAQKWAIDQKEKFQQYNSRQLSRIYPAGKRRPDDCSLAASAQLLAPAVWRAPLLPAPKRSVPVCRSVGASRWGGWHWLASRHAAGHRVNSSNYDPVPSWNAGCAPVQPPALPP